MDLKNLRALFAESLAFSDKDLSSKRISTDIDERRNGTRSTGHSSKLGISNKHHNSKSVSTSADRFNDETCMVFASFDQQRSLIIKHVSSNFFDLFPFFLAKDISANTRIESLIPTFLHQAHPKFLERFLNSQISEESSVNDAYRVKQKNTSTKHNSRRIFASISPVLIMPMTIDIRVNALQSNQHDEP